MRLDTECARRPPLLCHFSRRDEDREPEKLKKKYTQAAPKRESPNDGPVRVAPRSAVLGPWIEGSETSCTNISVIRESCADFRRVSTTGP